MAKQTDICLRSDVIYSIYVRNHTPEGTFRAVIPDLDRIRDLGADIIWLMPIHPIGVKGKKGSLGCPYANRDYRAVNPEYGTMEDFKALVDAIHQHGMKCIIDVVYNHTSPDAVLTREHPEFFYRKPDGNMGNRVGDWTDVVDLDYGCEALWDYQIRSLVMWAGIVDGFRCDVASFVPVEFWRRARQAVEQVRPGCIWLAETVHSGFGQFSRKSGMYSANDYEMFEAFDMEYDYDIREVFDRYLNGKTNLSNYIDALNFQECLYPENHIKMRCLENHDQPRFASRVETEEALYNFYAMLYFLRGTTLLYSGMEFAPRHQVSLFEKEDSFAEKNLDLQEYFRTLRKMKAALPLTEGAFWAEEGAEGIAVMSYDTPKCRVRGVFGLYGHRGSVAVEMPDGEYENLLGGTVTVKNGCAMFAGEPLVFGI